MNNLISIASVDITSEDSFNLLNSNNLHLICTANKKNSFANQLLSKLGESQIHIDKYCDMVNSKYEPGCLFPKYTLTLFPICNQESIIPIDQSLRKFFADSFEAQEKYFKSKTMIFCFDEHSWPDLTLVKSILEQELKIHQMEGIEAIYFYPF